MVSLISLIGVSLCVSRTSFSANGRANGCKSDIIWSKTAKVRSKKCAHHRVDECSAPRCRGRCTAVSRVLHRGVEVVAPRCRGCCTAVRDAQQHAVLHSTACCLGIDSIVFAGEPPALPGASLCCIASQHAEHWAIVFGSVFSVSLTVVCRKYIIFVASTCNFFGFNG